MKNTVNDYRNILTTLDTKTGLYKEVGLLPAQRLELSMDLLKKPGEMNLDERIFKTRTYAEKFDQDGIYCDYQDGTSDFKRFWEDAKKLSYSGLLIDDQYYATGDMIWYLNFIQIPDKVKRDQAFPMILDTDLWYFQHIELGVLNNKFTYTLKKRQIGVTLKLIAKLIKRFWFERVAKCKLAVWDEKYQTANWEILALYKDHLNRHTGWYRNLDPGKVFHWVQASDNGNGDKVGLKSEVKSVNTKTNPASVVSGGVTEAFIDEAGVNPNLDMTIGFLEPALKFGQTITGEVHVAGAVGNMTQCKPLKEFFYKPSSGNGYPIFIPEQYSYHPFIDEFGNSLVDEAKKAIEEEYDRQKKEASFEGYVLYKSQHPLTPEDCFNVTSDNPFNKTIIQPHYDWLINNYDPLLVTLNDDWYKIGSKHPLITDYPHNPAMDNTGAVVILEAPLMKNPPFGLYYAATDPIRPVKVKGKASLQAIYIYKAAHEIEGEFAQDKLVAWYTGRAEDPYVTYDITRKLVKMYNARHAVENDQAVFIEWLIGEGETKYLMKRSEMPILTDWVPKTTISGEEYGWRTGSGQSVVKQRLIDLAVTYVEEHIGTTFHDDGTSETIYGVQRIYDAMLLKEMLDYGDNTDRIIAFAGVLMAARSNTNRGFKVKKAGGDDGRIRQEALSRPRQKFNSLIRSK